MACARILGVAAAERAAAGIAEIIHTTPTVEAFENVARACTS